MDIDELIKRLEAATGPDRELDPAIRREVRRFIRICAALRAIQASTPTPANGDAA